MGVFKLLTHGSASSSGSLKTGATGTCRHVVNDFDGLAGLKTNAAVGAARLTDGLLADGFLNLLERDWAGLCDLSAADLGRVAGLDGFNGVFEPTNRLRSNVGVDKVQQGLDVHWSLQFTIELGLLVQTADVLLCSCQTVAQDGLNRLTNLHRAFGFGALGQRPDVLAEDAVVLEVHLAQRFTTFRRPGQLLSTLLERFATKLAFGCLGDAGTFQCGLPLKGLWVQFAELCGVLRHIGQNGTQPLRYLVPAQTCVLSNPLLGCQLRIDRGAAGNRSANRRNWHGTQSSSATSHGRSSG